MSMLDVKTATAVAGECPPVSSKPLGSGKKTPPSTLFLALLVVVATALPYVPALQYGFVYDDDVQAVQNVAAEHTQSRLAYFVTSIWTLRNSATSVSYRYYRPVFQTWLHLNAALFGDRAVWWHWAAILAHLAVTVLVFFLIRRHVRNPWSAAVGAMIFGVHPAHIESVAWVSGATDPLMALGVIGSFLLWMKNSEQPADRLLMGSLMCYATALLCKETAIVLPAVVFAYVLLGFALNKDAASDVAGRIMWAARSVLPFLVVAAIYFGIRQIVLHPFREQARPWLPVSEAVLTAPSVFFFYLKHSFWPTGLRLFYQFGIVMTPRSASFWAPLAAAAALAGCVFVWWRSTEDKTIPAAAAWFAIPLLPVLNIALFSRDDFIHDRYLYLPIIGLGILGGVLTDRLIAWAGSGSALNTATVALLLSALAGSTAVQSSQWRDNFSLYQNSARNSTNTTARMNLAVQYAALGRLKDADEILEPVVEERPDSWLAAYNLGYVHYRLGDLDGAEQLLDRAIAINPGDADAHLYRGLVLLRKEKIDDAEKEVRSAIAMDPSGEGYHFALGIMLMRQNPETAKAEFREELRRYPNNGLVKKELDNLVHPATVPPSSDAPAK